MNANVLKNKIKFTLEHSETELVFLDTKVHFKNGFLISEIYSKPTDSHEYLNPKSSHPPNVVKNIPYSIALRVRRNCSDRKEDDTLFKKNMISYIAYLLNSGYEARHIDRSFIKVAKMKRNTTLRPKRARCNQGAKKLNFVTTFDPSFPDIAKVIRKFSNILGDDEECKKVFPEGSFRVVYRRGHKNLKELLAPSGINDIYQQVKAKRVQQEGRCVKCGKCGSNPRGRKRDINLNNCSVLKEGTHFSSNNTREKFRIRHDINCRSKNIIYLVSCKKCTMQGVGHTMHFQKHISNYISHIHKKKPTCGIVKHFLLKEGHSVWDFEIMGIIQLENPPKSKEAIKAKLKESEAYWQLRLKTIEPFRMNLICEYLELTGEKGLLNN